MAFLQYKSNYNLRREMMLSQIKMPSEKTLRSVGKSRDKAEDFELKMV